MGSWLSDYLIRFVYENLCLYCEIICLFDTLNLAVYHVGFVC
jgi:hypothetical protein